MAVKWSIDPKVIDNVFLRKEPSIIAPPHTSPPQLPTSFRIDQGKLLISLARTQALTTVTKVAHRALQSIAYAFPELVDDRHSELYVLPDIKDIADAMRTAVAGMAGAGITDMVMDQVGYGWRANAREAGLVTPPCGSQQIPDFVYDPGALSILPLGSIALVEAKGSLSQSTGTPTRTIATALMAFADQVAPYLKPPGQKTITGLTLDYGYAVAFSSIPGQSSTTIAVVEPAQSTDATGHAVGHAAVASGRKRMVGASASVATEASRASYALHEFEEPSATAVRFMNVGGVGAAMQPMPMPMPKSDEVVSPLVRKDRQGGGGGGGGGRDGGLPPERRAESARVSGPIAFLNYAAAFRAIGAYEAADVLQSFIAETDLPNASAQVFLRLEVEGEKFLIEGSTYIQRYEFAAEKTIVAALGIYERSARAVLDSAKGTERVLPQYVDLPNIRESMLERRFTASGFSIQRDGLALVPITWPEAKITSQPLTWHQYDGWSD